MRKMVVMTVRTALLCAALFGFAMPASALNVTPPGDANGTQGPANGDVLAAADAVCHCVANTLYKQNNGGSEEGTLKDSYSTTFTAGSDGFTLTYGSGPAVTGSAWLLVKDGNHDPKWYLFNLSGWNGTETIVGSNFWPDQGGISHIELFGTAGTPTQTGTVPEPASLLLMGSGLGAAAWRARRRRQGLPVAA